MAVETIKFRLMGDPPEDVEVRGRWLVEPVPSRGGVSADRNQAGSIYGVALMPYGLGLLGVSGIPEFALHCPEGERCSSPLCGAFHNLIRVDTFSELELAGYPPDIVSRAVAALEQNVAPVNVERSLEELQAAGYPPDIVAQAATAYRTLESIETGDRELYAVRKLVAAVKN